MVRVKCGRSGRGDVEGNEQKPGRRWSVEGFYVLVGKMRQIRWVSGEDHKVV